MGSHLRFGWEEKRECEKEKTEKTRVQERSLVVFAVVAVVVSFCLFFLSPLSPSLAPSPFCSPYREGK